MADLPPQPAPVPMGPMGIQPGAGRAPVQWMPTPEPVPGCPPGLEYLTTIDQLLIHQIVEIFEMFTGIEMQNRYAIKNSVGQQVYFAYEESEFCHRQCCGPGRGFTMHIVDNNQQEVLRLVRPFKYCAGCGWCANEEAYAYTIQVEAPPGNTIGHVRQAQYWLGPKFDILDAEKNCVLKIQGPYCMCQDVCCQGDIDFDVFTKDVDTTIGKLSKQWPGCIKHSFTDADNFGLTFPADLHVNVKATLLAAVFLIDFMFFEQDQNDGGGGA